MAPPNLTTEGATTRATNGTTTRLLLGITKATCKGDTRPRLGGTAPRGPWKLLESKEKLLKLVLKLTGKNSKRSQKHDLLEVVKKLVWLENRQEYRNSDGKQELLEAETKPLRRRRKTSKKTLV